MSRGHTCVTVTSSNEFEIMQPDLGTKFCPRDKVFLGAHGGFCPWGM